MIKVTMTALFKERIKRSQESMPLHPPFTTHNLVQLCLEFDALVCDGWCKSIPYHKTGADTRHIVHRQENESWEKKKFKSARLLRTSQANDPAKSFTWAGRVNPVVRWALDGELLPVRRQYCIHEDKPRAGVECVGREPQVHEGDWVKRTAKSTTRSMSMTATCKVLYL